MAGRTDLTTHGYRKSRAAFLAANDVCHLCGHPAALTSSTTFAPSPPEPTRGTRTTGHQPTA
ncbi:hypothetical protein ACFYUH_09005 [Streptomyces fimicarius]|uniref:hypothetical protein n=1 Tax=Streptomyces griseus TaxID=1911 RepID=UPI0036C75B30